MKYLIADTAFILFVMSMIFLRLINELSINGVLFLPFNSNRDALIHLVAGNHARSFFS